MKYLYLLLILLIPQLCKAQDTLAWFTDAGIPGTKLTKLTKPADAHLDVFGSYGNGVLLDKSVGVDVTLQQARGMISFWIKPNWNGNDNQRHILIKMGDPNANGLLIEKSAQNTFRFVMAGGGKVCASRCDVSSWKAGEWHHIAASWLDTEGRPIGLPLWVDKICVDGPIYTGTSFMNPASMADKKVYIGDTSTNAVMDELIFRGSASNGQVTVVYRDYFQTAPYTEIKINHEPNKVRSETRVALGCKKQFGMKALKEGSWENITNFDVRYGQWSEYDAKPYITWSCSDVTIASVDTNGLVTGKAVGHCTLTAKFRGMTATYDLEVIPTSMPDLDLLYVERTPRYLRYQSKIWPDEGELVHSTVHLANFGYATVPSGTDVKFERIPDTNCNFKVDPDELPIDVRTVTIDRPLAQGETTSLTFDWNWTQSPVYIRVTLDPNNQIAELCEANNERCELNVARAFHWGRNDPKFASDYSGKHINLVGSFSDYDWCNAEMERGNVLMRETVLPFTSPNGIEDELRSDDFHSNVYTGNFEDEPWEQLRDAYDGGYPDMEPQNSTLMDTDTGILHEIGHVCLTQPDFYGYPFVTENMFVKDESGQPYANTPLFPTIDSSGYAMFCSVMNVPCNVGYSHLMVSCHQWMHPTSAGLTQHFKQTRMDLTRVSFSELMPTENQLKIYDVEDKPLKNAAIYVYQVVSIFYTDTSKYFPDRAKFIGNTDENGVWEFPKVTDETWDDPDTDEADGSVPCRNPFSTVWCDITSPCYRGGDEFLLKIVSGDKVEFQRLPMTDFLTQFFSGHGTRPEDPATYVIRTSLNPVEGGTPAVHPIIPDNMKDYNNRPVAVVPTEVWVKKGQPFSIDASQSYDPEGQPIVYRWVRTNGTATPAISDQPTLTGYGPQTFEDTQYDFYVIDGIRMSWVQTVNVRVAPSGYITGRVTDIDGNPMPNAVVGIKTGLAATADADTYCVTDASGYYKSDCLFQNGYYIAAWKDGWLPTADASVAVGETAVTKNLVLTLRSGSNLASGARFSVVGGTSIGSTPSSMFDGNTSTGWTASVSTYDYTANIYIDLGAPTDLGCINILRNALIDGYQCSGGFDIAVMGSGNPLDSAAWQTNSTVQIVYSLASCKYGCLIADNLLVEPIPMKLKGIRGVRLTIRCPYPFNKFNIQELQIVASAGFGRLADVKKLPVDTVCDIPQKQITAIPGGGLPAKTYYIEDDDRSSGLRIYTGALTSVNVAVDDVVDIAGTVRTTSTGEKFILASKLDKKATGVHIKPMGMNNRSAAVPIAKGLLVQIWGKVDSVGTNFFFISTGSKATMKVMCGTFTKPAQGKLIKVKGIISTDGTNNILLLSNQSDWSEIAK